MNITAKFPKHLVVIRDKVIDVTGEISMSFDMTNIYPTCSFELPLFQSGGFDTTTVKNYDNLEIYFNYFDTQFLADTATIDKMYKVFKGYVSDVKSSEGGGEFKTNVEGAGTAKLFFENTTLTKIFNSNLRTIVNKAIDEVPLFSSMTNSIVIDSNISDNLILKVDSSSNFGKVLQSIQEKYAINIFQQGNGNVIFKWPIYMFQNTATSFDFDLETTVANIDYGSQSNLYDTVVVVGNNCNGIAFDPISYQLKNSLAVPELNPDPAKLSILFLYRRDVISQESAQEIARNKLLDILKNYTLSFDSIFIPYLYLGDLIRIKNAKKVSKNTLFIVKSMNITIGETVKCSYTCYNNAAQDFPSDILLSNTGIWDTDILSVKTKEPKTVTLE